MNVLDSESKPIVQGYFSANQVFFLDSKLSMHGIYFNIHESEVFLLRGDL